MEKLCRYLSAVKTTTWRRSALAIYLTPFVLLFLILNILMDLASNMPAAVVSNSKVCVEIGKKVLEDGGSAVDAAIATLVCEGISLPNHAGIGGGLAATLYVRGKFDTIIAIPAVPKDIKQLLEYNSTYEKGPRSIGVPGELLGYWEMHKKYGILPWKRLFEPSIALAERGVPVSQYFAQDLLYNAPRLSMSPSMTKMFPRMNRYKEGDYIKYPTLAYTLKRIANEGVSIFYNGDLGRDFIRDIKQNGGVMKQSDLSSYKVTWDDLPPLTRINGHRLVTTPLPTSGPLLVLVINIIKSFDYHENVPLFWHKTLEALKFAFGLSGNLGDAKNDQVYKPYIMKANNKYLDQDFANHIRAFIAENRTFNDSEHYGAHHEINFEKGSLNVCVLGTHSDAVVVTTSISFPFGASFASASTGIIPNNILTRYLKKNTRHRIAPSDRPLPGKRIFTPHSPAIIVHSTKARPLFIIGATGGPKAISQTVTAIAKYIIFADSAYDAANANQGHNQLFPNLVEFSDNLDSDFSNFLREKGHSIVQKSIMFDNFTTVSCIGHRHEIPELQSDSKVGEKSQIVFPINGFNQNLVITTGGMLIIIIAILFYEVHTPLNQMVISKSRAII